MLLSPPPPLRGGVLLLVAASPPKGRGYGYPSTQRIKIDNITGESKLDKLAASEVVQTERVLQSTR
jgi:hypothetical protein